MIETGTWYLCGATKAAAAEKYCNNEVRLDSLVTVDVFLCSMTGMAAILTIFRGRTVRDDRKGPMLGRYDDQANGS